MIKPTIVKLTNFGAYLAAAILVLIPFHAILSVWIGSVAYDSYDIARLWKEALLVLLAAPVFCVLLKDKLLWRRLRAWPVFWLIAAYIGLHIILGFTALAVERVSIQAMLYGLVANLRFVWFFLACVLIAAKVPWLALNWRKILFVPAALVVGFGLLQAFVLPSDILSHIGYGPDTIPAYQTVDQKQGYIRVQSTLRGPNPLGAYLILVIIGAAAVLLGRKNSVMLRWAFGALLAGSIVVLAYTYSRSAYIGAAFALGMLGLLIVRGAHAKRLLYIAMVALVVFGGAATLVLRQNDQVQNILFHTNEHSLSPSSSNEERAKAMLAGVRDVASEPLGRGPGTAGPASVYNTNGGVRISENYYLQIGQEVGWLGVGLLAAVVMTVGRELFLRKRELLGASLLASLIGVSIVNVLSHAWMDDTLSLLWWGLAGICLVPAILKNTGNEDS
ncbi:MAG TPA: O-antigen ligase family protein [Candidatus Saccharimonadales bacterium]